MTDLNPTTALLQQAQKGIPGAEDQLFAHIYEELKRAVPRGALGNQRTLTPTALVHEVYLKLDVAQMKGNRAYFFGAIGNAMRQVLVDYYRKRRLQTESPEEDIEESSAFLDAAIERFQANNDVPLEELIRAIDELKVYCDGTPHEAHKRLYSVVNLRLFSEMTMVEIADALDVCLSTVEKAWKQARAWLKERIEERSR